MNFPISIYISLAMIGLILFTASYITFRIKTWKLSWLTGIGVGLLIFSLASEGIVAYALIFTGIVIATIDIIRSHGKSKTDED